MATRGRDILIYLSVKYGGEWDDIYKAIREKEKINFDLIKEAVDKCKANTITIIDDDYPSYLKNIYQPPFVLFYYGDKNLLKDERDNLSVVGSRECTKYGENVTRELVKSASKKYNIVSGLAKGIDSIAHHTCIENEGKTIAILGSGIDNCYPKQNISLYEEIKNNHLLISEYPNNVEPKKEHFPMRNRLIAAFSKALLVTEAHTNSGTLSTVSYALHSGKDVLCVPYPIDAHSICNRLIKDGAYLIENGSDLIDELK